MYIRQFKEISDKALWKKVEKAKELFRLARKYKLSEYMIEEIAEHIRVTEREEGYYNWKGTLESWWRNVAWYQPMSEEFIEKNVHIMTWTSISCNQFLTENFIDKYVEKLRWGYLCKYAPLSEHMIEKHKNRVDWKEIFNYQNLSEAFILKHQDKIKWIALMANRHLAKDFFERNKHLITVKLYATDLVKIIEGQTLSEETLREMKKGKMAWNAISENSELTRDFIIENYEKVNVKKVMRNRRTDYEVRKEIEMIEKLSGN